MIAPILATPCCCGNTLPETCCESWLYCGDRPTYNVQLGVTFNVTVPGIGYGTWVMNMQGTVQRPPGFFAGGCGTPYTGIGSWNGTISYNQGGQTCYSSLNVSGSGSANFSLHCGGSFCGSGFGVVGEIPFATDSYVGTVQGNGSNCYSGPVTFLAFGRISAGKVWSFGGTLPCPTGTYGGTPTCGAMVQAEMPHYGFASQAFDSLYFPGEPGPAGSINRRYFANTFVRAGNGVDVVGTETITVSVS